jgi:hypothetical protein
MLDREVVEEFLDWDWIRGKIKANEQQRDCQGV